MKTRTKVSIASLVLLAACGGGGSDDAPATDVAASPEPTSPAATPPSATPAPVPPPPAAPPAATPAAPPATTPPAPPAAVNAVPVIPQGFISDDRQPVAVSPMYPEPIPAATTELHLFSSENPPAYLGCLTCGTENELDICHAGGKYGSSTGEASVWNVQTPYGNPASSFSVWNSSSATGPVVVAWDKTLGNDPAAFSNYGQWTSNTSGPWKFGRATTGYLDHVADAYLRNNDVAVTRESVCGPE